MQETLRMMNSLLEGVKMGDHNDIPHQYRNTFSPILFAYAFTKVYGYAVRISEKFPQIDNEERVSLALKTLDRVLLKHNNNGDKYFKNFTSLFYIAYTNSLRDWVKTKHHLRLYSCCDEPLFMENDAGEPMPRIEISEDNAATEDAIEFEQRSKYLTNAEKRVYQMALNKNGLKRLKKHLFHFYGKRKTKCLVSSIYAKLAYNNI